MGGEAGGREEEKEGGLVWETVKRSGRSWNCGRFNSQGTCTFVSERARVCIYVHVCAYAYSWRGVGGVCEAYWMRVLAAARVNMKKPGAGHSTPP